VGSYDDDCAWSTSDGPPRPLNVGDIV